MLMLLIPFTIVILIWFKQYFYIKTTSPKKGRDNSRGRSLQRRSDSDDDSSVSVQKGRHQSRGRSRQRRSDSDNEGSVSGDDDSEVSDANDKNQSESEIDEDRDNVDYQISPIGKNRNSSDFIADNIFNAKISNDGSSTAYKAQDLSLKYNISKCIKRHIWNRVKFLTNESISKMNIGPENKRDIKYMPDNMLKTMLQYTMNLNYSYKERYAFWIKWQGEVKRNINEMKTITARQSKIALINGKFELWYVLIIAIRY